MVRGVVPCGGRDHRHAAQYAQRPLRCFGHRSIELASQREEVLSSSASVIGKQQLRRLIILSGIQAGHNHHLIASLRRRRLTCCRSMSACLRQLICVSVCLIPLSLLLAACLILLLYLDALYYSLSHSLSL